MAHVARSSAAQRLDDELSAKCLGVLIAHGEPDPVLAQPPRHITEDAIEVSYSVAGDGRRLARTAELYSDGQLFVVEGFPI